MKAKLYLLLKVICSVILLQTLYFKFTAAPESVFIFSTLGMEPWGRIGSGIAELIAGILLLIPRWDWAGAIIALGTISGALFFHITKLGIAIQGDGGYLFILAITVFIISLLVIINKRNQVPFVKNLFNKKG